MIEYPKIETVWNRDERTRKVIPGEYRLPEFGLIAAWEATEKIDGTNIRIGLAPNGEVQIGGRTDSAQVPTPLLSMLMATFKADRLREKFTDSDFTIFGEGYGPKIQSGGGYSDGPRFRVFDVKVGAWWLKPEDVLDVAQFFGIETAPRLGYLHTIPRDADALASYIDRSLIQEGGGGCRAEGLVCRAPNGLMTRSGQRLMWKLKFKDFPVAVGAGVESSSARMQPPPVLAGSPRTPNEGVES